MRNVLLLAAGIVLMANPDWFNGAHAAGLVLVIFGGFFCALGLLITLGVITAFGAAAASDARPARRRKGRRF